MGPDLGKLALEHPAYGRKRQEERGNFDGKRFEDVEVNTLDRLAVNWLRHEKTDYDRKMLGQ